MDNRKVTIAAIEAGIGNAACFIGKYLNRRTERRGDINDSAFY